MLSHFSNFDILRMFIYQTLVVLVVIISTWYLHAFIINIITRPIPFFSFLNEHLTERVRLSSRWLFVCLALLYIALPFLKITPEHAEDVRLILRPATLGVMGWVIASLVSAFGNWLERRYVWQNVEDNMLARRISTQTKVLTRSTIFLVILMTFIGVAMTIPAIRNLGISLFASAGVMGLVIGMAARPTITNLIAGLQIAMAQPIRLDDVVIVEGQWGRIEEITLTYVVVCIWDMRRLIIPLSYFIEKPFENWTHRSSQLLGTVTIYTDYGLPLEPVRTEVKRILDKSTLWDQSTCLVQVTETTDKSMEVRVLLSARDASKLYDLRCEVRENLLGFLLEHYSDFMPYVRTKIINRTPHEVTIKKMVP